MLKEGVKFVGPSINCEGAGEADPFAGLGLAPLPLPEYEEPVAAAAASAAAAAAATGGGRRLFETAADAGSSGSGSGGGRSRALSAAAGAAGGHLLTAAAAAAGAARRSARPWVPHVQSYAVATDGAGLARLAKHSRVFECHRGRLDAIRAAEVGASAAVLAAGYNIESFQLK